MSGDIEPWTVGAISAHFKDHKIIWRGHDMLQIPLDFEIIPVGIKEGMEQTSLEQIRPWAFKENAVMRQRRKRKQKEQPRAKSKDNF